MRKRRFKTVQRNGSNITRGELCVVSPSDVGNKMDGAVTPAQPVIDEFVGVW